MKFKISTAFVLTILALGLTALPAAAQSAPKDPRLPEQAGEAQPQPPQQPWVINCTNLGTADDLRCSMTQTIVARETGQRVLSALVFRDAASKALKMTLGLPHGLDLPLGISYGVDDKPRSKAPIRTADQSGSYTTIDISNDMLALLKAGKLMNVSVTAINGGEITLQLSLTGFASAASRL